MADYPYDVFLSHSSADKPAVRDLAERLKADGLRVWLSDWEIRPGDPIFQKIQQGLQQSRILLLCMSRQAFGSEWVTLEHQTILFRDPTNTERRFIPLRLDDAEPPDVLRQFAYVDWRTASQAEYARLLQVCCPPALVRPAEETRPKSELQHVFPGHKGVVRSVAVTADGRRAVSGSYDDTVRLWDLEHRTCLASLKGHVLDVNCVAVTADGRLAISGSDDGTVRVWDLERHACLASFEGHQGRVWGVAVTADGRRAISGSDDATVRLWDLERCTCLASLGRHQSPVFGLAMTADGRRAVSGSKDKTVRLWDLERRICLASLEGHQDTVWVVAVTADGRRAVSGSKDKTVRLWDLERRTCLASLEGHQADVWGVAVMADGRLAVSGSGDDTVRLWDLERRTCLASLKGHQAEVSSVAVTADGRRAVSGSYDNTVRLWDLTESLPVGTVPSDDVRYTNAKVLLTGKSGVGKTGLALRLVHDRYELTDSTEGVWATQLKLPAGPEAAPRLQREIWLWDFAGQADYRLVHQLYMDETALALLVFNPQDDNPFEDLSQWDRDLTRAAGGRPFRKLMVAGRCDRGGLRVSDEVVRKFLRDRGFDGYHETSARTGSGCEALRQAILETIRWDQIPWTVSPRIFKRIKEEILRLKDEGRVLLRLAELKQSLEMRMPGEAFTPGELTAVVGLLAGAGVVWTLAFAEYVLLQPGQISSYAAALVRTVRMQVDEIGCIAESDVLAGRLDLEGMDKRLGPADEAVVLRAMLETLVTRGLCLKEIKETGEAGPLLVFPSYFRRERPVLQIHPPPFVEYRFIGSLDEIYTTLVVRLHHTKSFDKDQLWRDAADFKTPAGQRAGIKLTRFGESVGELTVYLDPVIPDEVKVIFMRYVDDHLRVAGRATDIQRTRFYVCPHCGTPVEGRQTAMKRLQRGQDDMPCLDCEGRIALRDLIEQKFASEEAKQGSRAWEQQAQAGIDNESRELILVGQAFAIAGEAGQIFRPTPNADWGIDGEIEFKDYQGRASGQRVYLQLKSGDSYLSKRQRDEAEIFSIKNPRHADYWRQQAYPVMLVVRTSDGQIRWMDVGAYLKQKSRGGKPPVRRIEFHGEPFTAQSLIRLRDRLVPPPGG
jgi:WD40 repeat protein